MANDATKCFLKSSNVVLRNYLCFCPALAVGSRQPPGAFQKPANAIGTTGVVQAVSRE
jgi:hypothetical protein